jgi:hypothetical protein
MDRVVLSQCEYFLPRRPLGAAAAEANRLIHAHDAGYATDLGAVTDVELNLTLGNDITADL